MEPLHARYPFLDDAKEAVEAAGVDFVELITREERPAVERAVERVESALVDGTVGGPHRSTRVELLSYPIARVLVSLVDERVLVRKYARAEAEDAMERFSAERAAASGLKSAGGDRLSADELLAEFDIADDVHDAPEGYRVDVGAYLRLASDVWGDEWRLVNRTLADGRVFIESGELETLLREAIVERVEAGLPLGVPDVIADALEGEVAHVREVLADLELTRDIDTVVPERFPPCMKALLDDIQKGEHLEHHSRFAITAFLTSIGMSTDDIVELYMVNSSFGEEMTRYQTNHIRGESGPTQYSPPSCATMQSYGDCVNMDDRCERISHPLAYYEEAIDDADEEELVDWRKREDAEEGEA